MKTIILTENQIKRVLTTINSEKKLVNEQVAQLKPIKQFNINNSFKSGQFQLTNTTEIDAAISEINVIVSKTPTQNMTWLSHHQNPKYQIEVLV